MPYLYRHQNQYAPRRSNGLRFWGYPSRTKGITAIGVHTAEITPSPGSAENIAHYFSHTDRPASYHQIVDSDSTVRLLPDEATAFGIRGFNSPCLQLSFATRAASWGRYPQWDRLALERGAQVAAEWCRRHLIPVRRITRTQAQQGVRGLVAHGTMDPGRRSDPGAGFPWQQFLHRVKALIKEDEVAVTEEDINKIIDGVARRIQREGLHPRTKQDIAVRAARLVANQGLAPRTKESIAEYVWAAQPSEDDEVEDEAVLDGAE